MNHLAGQTIIITGASRGIGAAAARFLAQNGASVVLGARSGQAVADLAAQIGGTGGRAAGLACDVAQYDQVQALVDLALSRDGKVDVIVNNAGLIDPIARLSDSVPEDWGHVVDVNLKGVYHGLRAVLPHMADRGTGTIINISSGAATGALEGWSHYCATKAAVLSLTKCVHKEYGEQGIRSVGLSPGTVATEMQVQIKASGVNPVSQLDPSVHIPADWVAQAIGYLCGPGAEGYLGTDFTLKTPEGRAAAGLPAV